MFDRFQFQLGGLDILLMRTGLLKKICFIYVWKSWIDFLPRVLTASLFESQHQEREYVDWDK